MQGSIGESLVAGYFKYVKGCDFIQKNLKVGNGELDVAGIDLSNKIVYCAEVAIHLETGLQYTQAGKRVNVERLTEKFCKDISYIKAHFPDYQHKFSLWSPIVKKATRSDNKRLSQLEEVSEAQKHIYDETNVEIELIINDKFMDAINELKTRTASISAAIEDNDILRYMQLETKLKKFLQKSY